MRTTLLFFSLALAFPAQIARADDGRSPCLGRCPDPAQTGDDAPRTASRTRTVRFRVHGMLTPSCPRLLAAAARRVAGVVRVEASLEERSATIEYVEGETSVAEIQRVIKDRTGFDTEVVGS